MTNSGKHWNTIPGSVKQRTFSFLLTREWSMLHNTDIGNSMVVYCGTPGTGKSDSCADRCIVLGVDEHDEPTLFNPAEPWHHVCFDAPGFEKIYKEASDLKNKGKGYQIMWDEAEIDVFSKDWQKRHSKDLVKTLSSVRKKRWSICFTLPTFGMLNADIQRLCSYYCEMEYIDEIKGRAYSKLNIMDVQGYTGDIWRYNPVFSTKRKNPFNGLPIKENFKLGQVYWEQAPKVFWNQYEKMKDEFLDDWHEGMREDRLREIESKKNKQNKMSLSELLSHVKDNAAVFTNPKGDVDWGLIVAKSPSPVGQNLAKKVASLIAAERGEKGY